VRIAIGIMLWNEEGSIGLTIDSLFEQTLLSEMRSDVEQVEVVALANGCTDNSVPEARAAFDRNLKKCRLPYVQARVEELPGPNRANAWNQFVHHLTAPDTTYILLMDADIYINHRNAIASMVDGLQRDPYHPVAAALGIKDLELKPRKSLLDRLSLAMTRMEHQARLTYLCGGLYCGRASFLRRLEFPKGWVCGDDGFIAHLAITNFMTTEYQFDRILHPADASFVFEAYTTTARIFRQHVRRYIGLTVRGMIVDYVRAHQNQGQPDAGEILRRACREEPDWLNQLVRERTTKAGFWIVSPRAMLARFTQLRGKSLAKKLLKLPLAIAGSVWQTGVILAANRRMRAGRLAGVWENNRNGRLVVRPIA
jgi:glycosyltransferase involved in cell wall biosynthesis